MRLKVCGTDDRVNSSSELVHADRIRGSSQIVGEKLLSQADPKSFRGLQCACVDSKPSPFSFFSERSSNGSATRAAAAVFPFEWAILGCRETSSWFKMCRSSCSDPIFALRGRPTPSSHRPHATSVKRQSRPRSRANVCAQPIIRARMPQ